MQWLMRWLVQLLMFMQWLVDAMVEGRPDSGTADMGGCTFFCLKAPCDG